METRAMGDVRVRSPRGGRRRDAPRKRLADALRGVLKVVIGVGAPILVVWLLLSSLGNFRFTEPPPPAALDAEAPEGDASVELVGSPDGRWVVAEGSGSYVGYRVTEHYPTRTSTGVGRTTDVDAEMVVEGGVITHVEVHADLRELTSNRVNRDRAARARYLETDEHPAAVFELTEPVPLHDAAPGSPFSAEAEGELTIRGITRPVTVQLESRWDGGAVQVVGRLPVHLPDYDVRVPDIPGFVTVEEDAEVEVDLTFERVDR